MVLAPFVNYNMGAKNPFTAEAAHNQLIRSWHTLRP